MKRVVICSVITVILTAIAITSSILTDKAARRAEETINGINESFEEEDYETVKSLSEKLISDWESFTRKHIFMLDKEQIVEITNSVARVKALADEEDPEITIESTVALKMIEQYRLKNLISWENIF